MKEKIVLETRKHLELNDSENTKYQKKNLKKKKILNIRTCEGATKVVLR